MHGSLRKDERTGQTRLWMVPENDLEEKFFLYFSFHYGVSRGMLGRRECLLLPPENDPELAVRNLFVAFQEFCKRFRYVEIPNLYGLEPARAQSLLRAQGLTWEVEGMVEDRRYPPGSVAGQRPPPGVASLPQGVVRLMLNRGDAREVVRPRKRGRSE